jgi:hypothetical protein
MDSINERTVNELVICILKILRILIIYQNQVSDVFKNYAYQVPYGSLKWQKWAMHFSLSMQHNNLSNLVYNLPRYFNSRELILSQLLPRELVFVLLHCNVLLQDENFHLFLLWA